MQSTMEVLTTKELEDLKKKFLPGQRIKLISMADVQAPESGTLGTVRCVDDIGTVHMKWDTGSGLGLIPGVDQFEIITK